MNLLRNSQGVIVLHTTKFAEGAYLYLGFVPSMMALA